MLTRWFSFGKVAYGKSILGKKLIEEFQKANPTAVTQVYDPKMQGEYHPIVLRSWHETNEYCKNLLRFKMD